MSVRAFVASLSLLAAGCGDEAPPRLIDPRADAAADASDASGDGATDAGGDASTGPRYEVLRLDAARSEFPDAVTTREGRGYVALRSLRRVIEVSPDGNYRAYAEGPPNASIRGIAFDLAGRMLLTVVSTTASQSGLWRVDAGGGVATLFFHDDALVNPAGVAVDSTGALWVTDSDPGAVWRAPPGGGALARWSNAPELAGGAVVCGATGAVRTGANAIAVDLSGGAVYVTNPDRSTVVRLPIASNDAVGTVTVHTSRDCPRLAGAWGITVAPGNTFLVTANTVNAITRVARDGTLTTIDVPAGLLRSPAGLAWDADNAVLWLANSANADATRPGGNPLPGVVRLPIR
ncbi:MAG: hypothetical protein U0326_41905 [Polyangiales bacterium]